MRVVSLADPEDPVEIPASFEGLASCHDVFAENNRLYVSEGSQGSVGIYDVTNPGNPVLLRRFGIPNAGYVHNAWASEDGALLMTTEETTGRTVKLWDISDPDSITLKDDYLAPEGLAHNTHLMGSYAYISHYKDGLRIVDISSPTDIFEAGFYDTYNDVLSGSFHGAWGAFPFFESGKILVSDMESGLYVVSFDAPVASGGEGRLGGPSGHSLLQNYPNPFNPTTTIPFEIAEGGFVRLAIYDLLGREVDVLLETYLQAGRHSARFNAKNLPSGIYWYRLEAPGRVMVKRMAVVQ